MIYGNEALTDLKSLPLDKSYSRIHYEGSIDKGGRNADWDWHLFPDPDHNGEWVIFDAEGPGCILNFTQHRYPTSDEPTFRFYFDGENEPRFTIKHSQFGEIYPFTEPVASRYIGPIDRGYGPIRVVRSFAPLSFEKHCRVTSDIYLDENRKDHNGGGWGHIVWQSFADGTGKVKTFDIDDDTGPVTLLWKKKGDIDVVPFENGITENLSFDLTPGEKKVIFSQVGAGLISGIRMIVPADTKKALDKVIIRAYWNGSKKAQINCSLGCLCGNELGYHTVKTLMTGFSTDGSFYNNYPMPYGSGCLLELENTSDASIAFSLVQVRHTEEYNGFYASNKYGVINTSEYSVKKSDQGVDSIIGHIHGNGHLVSALITAEGILPDIASCEGNVRVHIDGCRTPSMDSDGSESYASYGWGFPTPPECNPASGYDGTYDYMEWCELRHCMADPYYFGSELRFSIEKGEFNNRLMKHSGILFWYGSEESKMDVLADMRGNIPAIGGNRISVTSVYESDEDDKPESYEGFSGAVVAAEVEIPGDVNQVVLRRVSDQCKGRQYAEVYVDGALVEEFGWYQPDSNEIRRLYEDEFVIPKRYTDGKKRVKIEIKPSSKYGNPEFTVLDFKILGYK